jgi:hypothetical protein
MRSQAPRPACGERSEAARSADSGGGASHLRVLGSREDPPHPNPLPQAGQGGIRPTLIHQCPISSHARTRGSIAEWAPARTCPWGRREAGPVGRGDKILGAVCQRRSHQILIGPRWSASNCRMDASVKPPNRATERPRHLVSIWVSERLRRRVSSSRHLSWPYDCYFGTFLSH